MWLCCHVLEWKQPSSARYYLRASVGYLTMLAKHPGSGCLPTVVSFGSDLKMGYWGRKSLWSDLFNTLEFLLWVWIPWCHQLMSTTKSLFLLQCRNALLRCSLSHCEKGEVLFLVFLLLFSNLIQHMCKRDLVFGSKANLCGLWAQCQAKGWCGQLNWAGKEHHGHRAKGEGCVWV